MGPVILAMVFETGWVIIAAVGVALVVLLIEGPQLSAALPQFPAEGIALVIIVALTAPAAVASILSRWRPRPLARLLGDAESTLPGVWPTLTCVAIYIAGFSVTGLALDLLAQGPLAAADSHYVLMTGVFAIAWGMGAALAALAFSSFAIQEDTTFDESVSDFLRQLYEDLLEASTE